MIKVVIKKESTYCSGYSRLKYLSNRSFNIPPGIPRAFDTFVVPERREFDYQTLPGGGEFDPLRAEFEP